MKNLIPVEWSNRRVLTTAQAAEALECSADLIRMHFRNHKEEFKEGVHYFHLKGASFRDFRNNINDVYGANSPYHFPKNVSHAMLWTCQGVARVSKLIDTPNAWKLFTELETFYFNAAEENFSPPAEPAQDILDTSKELADLRTEVEELRKELAELKGQFFDPYDPAELVAYQEHLRDVECGKILAKMVFVQIDSPLKEQLVREAANLLLGKEIF